jgi:PTH1 family peptidyl-tRNA hydrolase
MKIVVGLGNPGPQYETTRHNVGFLAIDRLVERWKASGPIHKNHGEVYQTTFDGESVLLIKPQTYMNLSGKSVSPLYHFYRCKADDLIVIHDDLDLQPLSIRLKAGGGTGGHNGLKSIDEQIGKDHSKYYRVRVGIGRPGLSDISARISPADYVLMQFSDQEVNELDPLLDNVAGAVEEILRGRFQSAMNHYHRSK